MKTIFVSIASYLDPDFKNTVRDCLEKAEHPERVIIGLHLQDKPEVMRDYLTGLTNNNVRTLITQAKLAKGCGWARNEIMKNLYDNEDYFFLVDSHSRFKQNWDSEYIQRLEELPINSVISAFPRHFEFEEDYETYSKRNKPSIYVPNEIPFVGNFKGPHKQKLSVKRSEKVMNISGGNTFGPGTMVKALLLDEFNYYGHQEQEIYSLLLYKCGFDIFAIDENIIWHKYVERSPDTYRPIYNEKERRINFWPDLKEKQCNNRSWQSWVDDYNTFCKSIKE